MPLLIKTLIKNYIVDLLCMSTHGGLFADLKTNGLIKGEGSWGEPKRTSKAKPKRKTK